MEMMDGDLHNLLKENNLTIKQATFWICQIIDCCKALKDNPYQTIVHRDLKPDNFLYRKINDYDYIFKLADFGVSKYEDTE